MKSKISLMAFLTYVPMSFAQPEAGSQKKGLNPDISVNLLGLVQYGTEFEKHRKHDSKHEEVHGVNGLQFQSAELQFAADVDPYLRANALFAFHGHGDHMDFEAEEAYFETTRIPSLSLKVGKQKLPFGKHNLLHTHAYPFVDAPLSGEAIFGEEGLNEMAVTAAYLLPTSWFSEITLSAFDASNKEVFGSPMLAQYGMLGRVKNLIDLNDSSTAELGLSIASGQNSADKTSNIYGADLTFKWRPVEGGKYESISWTTEYLFADKAGEDATGGLATWLQYQLSQRWWVQGRYEILGLPKPSDKTHKVSVLVGLFPSEFSGFRLQYSWEKETDSKDAGQYVGLQYNISIGAHPAHAY